MDQSPRVQTAAINILSQALADATLGDLTRTSLQVGSPPIHTPLVVASLEQPVLPGFEHGF